MIDLSGLRVLLTHPNACLPTKSYESAGYDLRCVNDLEIAPGCRECIPLGFATEIPCGYFGRVMDRSGLASRDGLTVLGGVIDNDYRGEWKVILQNTSYAPVRLRAGDRVAQVVFLPYGDFPVVQVIDLGSTERGGSGFGSTGR